MIVSCATDVGCVRRHNEDSYLCIEPKLFAVADGMGGHAAGEIASNIMVDTLKEQLGSEKCDDDKLRRAVMLANEAILKKANEYEEYAGMGTTISLLAFQDDIAHWVHVGDSRIYLWRNHEMSQLTSDHSLVNELLQRNKITDEEAEHYPNKNILTRAAGVSLILEIDSGEQDYLPGDKFILCTDGLTNMVPEEKINEVCGDSSIESKAKVLVEEAVNNGGRDNITCIVVEIND